MKRRASEHEFTRAVWILILLFRPYLESQALLDHIQNGQDAWKTGKKCVTKADLAQ